ncbi:hypothetical protein PGB90_004127 [Kerria lacca]
MMSKSVISSSSDEDENMLGEIFTDSMFNIQLKKKSLKKTRRINIMNKYVNLVV